MFVRKYSIRKKKKWHADLGISSSSHSVKDVLFEFSGK